MNSTSSLNESILEIIASSLTDNSVGDSTEVPNLLDQIENLIDEFIGDGAYDTKKIYSTVESRAEEGKQVLSNDHCSSPRVIGVDKNAACPPAFKVVKEKEFFAPEPSIES